MMRIKVIFLFTIFSNYTSFFQRDNLFFEPYGSMMAINSNQFPMDYEMVLKEEGNDQQVKNEEEEDHRIRFLRKKRMIPWERYVYFSKPLIPP